MNDGGDGIGYFGRENVRVVGPAMVVFVFARRSPLALPLLGN